jgi:hypothetical protein
MRTSLRIPSVLLAAAVAVGISVPAATAVSQPSSTATAVPAKIAAPWERGSKAPRPPKDRTPPGQVSSVTVSDVTSSSVVLSWANPSDPDLAEVIVRRAEGAVAPTDARQGTAVPLSAPTASTVTDNALLAASVYSWSIFTKDAAGNTSAPVTISATTAPGVVPIGYDVSWPQCSQALPVGQAFAIVGVNGGLANNTNPCLSQQLAWAQQSTGTTAQPKVALYVNTANPAKQATSWPTSNVYPASASQPVTNPYGTCVPGEYGPACAFMYGYARAHDDATIRGVPDPASHFWWLDVEIGNTWQEDTAANRAVLEGMAHYFGDVLGAAGVGIYATTQQWGQIVGQVGAVDGSLLNGLPSWIPGARTLAGAQAACGGTPLTGGRITVTQYLLNNLDHDFACAS